jgi:hypothetical protein
LEEDEDDEDDDDDDDDDDRVETVPETANNRGVVVELEWWELEDPLERVQRLVLVVLLALVAAAPSGEMGFLLLVDDDDVDDVSMDNDLVLRGDKGRNDDCDCDNFLLMVGDGMVQPRLFRMDILVVDGAGDKEVIINKAMTGVVLAATAVVVVVAVAEEVEFLRAGVGGG